MLFGPRADAIPLAHFPAAGTLRGADEANARLIAAAPELLEAALAVLRSREDGTFGPDGQQGFKMLADAAAKAEGNS